MNSDIKALGTVLLLGLALAFTVMVVTARAINGV